MSLLASSMRKLQTPLNRLLRSRALLIVRMTWVVIKATEEMCLWYYGCLSSHSSLVIWKQNKLLRNRLTHSYRALHAAHILKVQYPAQRQFRDRTNDLLVTVDNPLYPLSHSQPVISDSMSCRSSEESCSSSDLSTASVWLQRTKSEESWSLQT